ncbi:MAG: phage tail protein [Caldilineaceae bacterium]|nr:phage tail protein [Caldilineaceae bacterium]
MADGALFTAFRFDVELRLQQPNSLNLSDPLCQAAFAECDGLEMTMEPKTVQEGGFNLRQTHLVGPVTYGTLSLKRGMTSNFDLWTWFSAAASSVARGLKADGYVTMRNAAGEVQVKFKVNGCLPIKIKAPALNAKDGLLAIEEMQLAYSNFTVEPA